MAYWDSTFSSHTNFSTPFAPGCNILENRFNFDYTGNIFNQPYGSPCLNEHSSLSENKLSSLTSSSSSKNYLSTFGDVSRSEPSYFTRPHEGNQFDRLFPSWRNDEKKTKTSGSSIHVTLENKFLLEKFDKYCTEMIITKSGRRMFPAPLISVKGLQSSKKYFVLFDIVPADDNRYKYQHFNWVVAGKAEPPMPPRMYIHPDSPLTGNNWMKQKISFGKVKLTNNTCDQMGHIVLNSMHRYQPRIHVVEADDVYSMQFQPFHTYVFTECRFIAVTAYQNSQVTNLKIENNPFAKGFREAEKQKRAKRKSQSEDDSSLVDIQNGIDEGRRKQGNETESTNRWENPSTKRHCTETNIKYEENLNRKAGELDAKVPSTEKFHDHLLEYHNTQMYCGQLPSNTNSNERESFNFNVYRNFEPAII